MINDNKQYGMMLIASNEENFFDKGISYYETCMVEYNVSVKSTKLYLQTQDMARKDGLTQIYNRVYFGQLFAAAAEEATKKQKPLSVALFDIDKFKNINDTYGHLKGDYALIQFGKILQYSIDKDSVAIRMGGDEFVIFAKLKSDEEALALKKQIEYYVRQFNI